MAVPPNIPKTMQSAAVPPKASYSISGPGAPVFPAQQGAQKPQPDVSRIVPKPQPMKPRSPQPFVAQPLRDIEGPRDPQHFTTFMRSLAARFPSLKRNLAQAGMNYTPAGYVFSALVTAIYITAALLLIIYILIKDQPQAILITILLAIALYGVSFLYAMNYPQVKMHSRAKKMEQELVFAGRHMLIELKSGIPLFDAMLGITRDYGEVSAEFNKVVEKITLGVPMGAALHEIAEENPSQYFKRVVLQVANSIASGSDVATALEASLDQVSNEQTLELKAYGQKLNPIVMFFMIFGIILPSLGVAFLIIMVSFLGGSAVSFGPSTLFWILLAIGLLQFLFLTMVESSRPKFDIV